jgi:hypothetical protein
VRLEDGWLFLDTGAYVDVPSEVYLREFRDTAPGDVDQLARLCSLGVIRPVFGYKSAFDDLPWTTKQSERELEAVAEELGLPLWSGDEAERREVWERGQSWPVHVTEVAPRVRYVQRCTEHLLLYRAGEPVRQAWPYCDNDELAWHYFTETTGVALRDFHVRVSVATGNSPPELNLGGIQATLYTVAMLQLVNDLAQDVPYLRCANEACGRLFARQRGRTEHGGNRMRGVMYCSNTCARAQYQREKRRRDRAAKRRGASDE